MNTKKYKRTQLNKGEFQSGQMGQTVNLLSLTSVVRIHPLPPPFFNIGDIGRDMLSCACRCLSTLLITRHVFIRQPFELSYPIAEGINRLGIGSLSLSGLNY